MISSHFLKNCFNHESTKFILVYFRGFVLYFQPPPQMFELNSADLIDPNDEFVLGAELIEWDQILLFAVKQAKAAQRKTKCAA